MKNALNNTIKERYCSFEICKLLKKAGFFVDGTQKFWFGEDKGTGWYGVTSNQTLKDIEKRYFDDDNLWIEATQAQAVEWLFVNFGIFIDLSIFNSHFWIRIQAKEGKVLHNIINEPKDDFKSIEEAYNAGLKHILTSLI